MPDRIRQTRDSSRSMQAGVAFTPERQKLKKARKKSQKMSRNWQTPEKSMRMVKKRLTKR